MRCVTGKPNLIKLVNKNLILEMLEQKGAISRAELAKLTKISPPTVSTIINELIEAGIVTELGEGDSSGGRKPTMLAYNPCCNQLVGIELKEGKFHAILTNLIGEIYHEEYYCCERGYLPIEQLIQWIRRFLDSAKLHMKGSLKGIGIAIPGATDRENGTIIEATSLGWKDVALSEMLEMEFRVPILVDHAVHLAALGEHWRGVGQQTDHMVFVSIGKEIGAGMILNGELYRGSAFFAGEIGHMIVSPHTLLNVEEGYGPLEYYGSRAIQKALRKLPEVEHHNLISEATHHLAYALVNIITLLNPRMIIIDTPDWLEGEIDLLKEIVHRYTPTHVELVKSALHGYASLYGAVYSVLKHEQASVVYRQEG